MIVGEHNRSQDLDLNVCKAKQLTNHRAASGDELVAATDTSRDELGTSLGIYWF